MRRGGINHFVAWPKMCRREIDRPAWRTEKYIIRKRKINAEYDGDRNRAFAARQGIDL